MALVLAGANTNGLLGAGSFLVSVFDASGVESCPKENVPGTEKKKNYLRNLLFLKQLFLT